MDQLAIARRALEDEIAALRAEVHRLEIVLTTIDPMGTGSKASATIRSEKTGTELGNAAPAKRRGRPAKNAKANNSGTDIGAVLKIIEDAGKGGIKALSLASQLKKNGQGRPSKVELLETEKVKVSGKGGGTTYNYVG